jgi:hypothetical protein
MKIHWKCLLFLVLLTFGAAGVRQQEAFAASPNIKTKKVVVGGLFSLTGGWSTLGQSSKAVLEIVVEDVNVYLSGLEGWGNFLIAGDDGALQSLPGFTLPAAAN